MPTGYTANLTPDSSFRDFALSVARGFGALIHMRDEPSNAPLTLPEPSDYHQKELAKTHKLLAKLSKMTPRQMQVAADKEYAADLQYYIESRDKARLRRNAYQQMLAKVTAWDAPTAEHEGVKADMVRQLTESDRFDNDVLDRPRPAPSQLTGQQWYKKALERANRDLAYHTEEEAEEQKRTNERNQWIIDLQNSLPA